ncbi:MAG: hypothetical protein GX587_12975 [Bacteroidales bacterium]|nr:hypothetical protein [Bacteroidales bacterium]
MATLIYGQDPNAEVKLLAQPAKNIYLIFETVWKLLKISDFDAAKTMFLEILEPLGIAIDDGNIGEYERRFKEYYFDLQDLRPHLIYAYMAENTKIFEIFQKVLFEFCNGEKLGIPDNDTRQWLETTEALFFRDPFPFAFNAISSHIRPDMRAVRRNAYWRMFGMDLNHANASGQVVSFVKPQASNLEFVNIFEELLRESFIAIVNFNNTSGPNPTDGDRILVLIDNLSNMLKSRRNGNLNREEFLAVLTMAWFRFAVSSDSSPLLKCLRITNSGEDQRLFRIAEMIGEPAHAHSNSFFEIAVPISQILKKIETEPKSLVANIVSKYTATVSGLNDDQKLMNKIITHWSIITGRDMKAGKVTAR